MAKNTRLLKIGGTKTLLETADITKEDWENHYWVNVVDEKQEPAYMRGIKKTSPPNDGYKYVEVTTFADNEQKWARAQEYLQILNED